MDDADAPTRPLPLVDGLAWPESPRWRDGELWFSDVHHLELRKVGSDCTLQRIARVAGRPAGMGFMGDGRLLVASALERRLWWVQDDGSLRLAVDLSHLTRGLLNDMVVDQNGRAWVGDTGFDLLRGEPQQPGSLITWTPGESPRIAAEDLRFPNGIAIPGGGGMLYLAETFGQKVSAFRLDGAGTLSDRRTHVELPGRPDGMCLDAEGGLWIALLWDERFVRIDAAGRQTDEILTPGERAISCTLGGADRRTLFLGVARVDERDKADIRRDGRVRTCRVRVPGAGVP